MLEKFLMMEVYMDEIQNFKDCFSAFATFAKSNPQVMQNALECILKLKSKDGMYLENQKIEEVTKILVTCFGEHTSVVIKYISKSEEENKALIGDVDNDISCFLKTVGDLIRETRTKNTQYQKDFALSVRTLKDGLSEKTFKKRNIITSWIVKWASYLKREDSSAPYRQCGYLPGQIILVDFGFRVGNELGGRHYAVVIENNCNPKSGTILLAPVSSYDPKEGEYPRPYNVDLGIGVISNNDKGAEVLISQIGFYSKIRIENSKKKMLPPKLYNRIVDALYKKIGTKKKNT